MKIRTLDERDICSFGNISRIYPARIFRKSRPGLKKSKWLAGIVKSIKFDEGSFFLRFNRFIEVERNTDLDFDPNGPGEELTAGFNKIQGSISKNGIVGTETRWFQFSDALLVGDDVYPREEILSVRSELYGSAVLSARTGDVKAIYELLMDYGYPKN